MIPLNQTQSRLLAELLDLHTDKIRSILAKLGLDIDLDLTAEENYSEKTRKRAYWPRIQKLFREIPEDYRESYFANLGRELLEGKVLQATNEVRANDNSDHYFARLAIEEARKSISEKDGRPHPLVGAVVVKAGEVVATAHRGEADGNHAEYIALEKRLGEKALAGATVYTTLEPCTTRNHPKIPCAERLIERRVRRVVIGMLDPDHRITGRGLRRLRAANIITELFPHELMAEVEELNREFTRHCESHLAYAEQAVAKPAELNRNIQNRIEKHRAFILPKVESPATFGLIEIACYPEQLVEIPVNELKNSLESARYRLSEALRYTREIEVFQNGVSVGHFRHKVKKDVKSSTRFTLYTDGFVAFDALADNHMRGDEGIHAGWLCYELQRHLQLVKLVLNNSQVKRIRIVLDLKDIEQIELSVPSTEGQWLNHYQYAGSHDQIARIVNLEDIHDFDSDRRNKVMPIVIDMMEEVFRIFGQSDASTLWDENHILRFVKGLENQR